MADFLLVLRSQLGRRKRTKERLSRDREIPVRTGTVPVVHMPYDNQSRENPTRDADSEARRAGAGARFGLWLSLRSFLPKGPATTSQHPPPPPPPFDLSNSTIQQLKCSEDVSAALDLMPLPQLLTKPRSAPASHGRRAGSTERRSYPDRPEDHRWVYPAVLV